MIQLASKQLEEKNQIALNDLQAKIDSKLTFAEKKEKAESLWKNKGGETGKLTFAKIRDELSIMCVNVEICNYCELSEANDIEHINPKSFFPESTFKWENYLLACKQCNTGHKLDQCYVLDNNEDLVEMKRGEEPLYKVNAFINIRIEDPNGYMILVPQTWKFEILPDLDKKSENIAKSTIKILELNDRSALLEGRKKAAIYYYDRMKQLFDIMNATSREQVDDLLSPYDDKFDDQTPLEQLKNEILLSIKRDINKHTHPSVWHSIKLISSKTDSKWKVLFAKIPDALNW